MDLTEINLAEVLNVDKYTEFLDDIGAMLNLFLRIHNLAGDTVCPATGAPEELPCANGDARIAHRCLEACRKLTEEIIESGGHMTISCPLNRRLHGFAISTSHLTLGTLIACEATAGSGNGGGRDRPSAPASEESQPEPAWERILCNAAGFIANECYQNVELDKLTAELDNCYEELNLIYDVVKKMKSTNTIEKTIQFLAEESKRVLDQEYMTFISAADGRCMVFTPSGSVEAEVESNLQILSKQLSSDAYSSPEPKVFHNLSEIYNMLNIEHRFNSALVIPLFSDNKAYGTLNIFRDGVSEEFLSGEVRLMDALSKRTSNLIRTGELYHNLQDLFLNLLKSLVFVIEAKDQYTSGHSERVNQYSLYIGRLMQYGTRDMEILNAASLLHDIGKMKIPGRILRKTRRLTRKEWTIIKDHPSFGAKILSPIKELKKPVMGVMSHHERWDGAGYPEGLKGEEIPEIARIISIADTYDALTSKRPYRNKLKHIETIEEIQRCIGTQFDPEIASIFVKDALKIEDWSAHFVKDVEFQIWR